MPHVSVIVPAYNSEKYIEECLQAIKGSLYKDFELIVVDDCSNDATCVLAKKYADKMITHEKNFGRGYARNDGIKAAQGEIIVNIDSDIVIQNSTLGKIVQYFHQHQDVSALTGLLSLKHPHRNFFSQYKNLYMHYIFCRLPERVNFLYASICAFRRSALQAYDPDYKRGIDTELGQRLRAHGRQIAFLKDLEVTHLKKYNFFSFIKNDFCIAFYWAKIFCFYRAWKQLGKDGMGFAHSSLGQLVCVVLAFSMLSTSIFSALLGRFSFLLIAPLLALWLILNLRFFAFLIKERGVFFGVRSVFLTLLDNMIMSLGILSGFIAVFVNRKKRTRRQGVS